MLAAKELRSGDDSMKPGPPKKIKSNRLYLRLDDEEKTKVVADAQAEGLSLSAYVRARLGLPALLRRKA